MRLSIVIAAFAVLAADGALLRGWARRPTIAIAPGERLVYLAGTGENLRAGVEGPEGRRRGEAGQVVARSGPGQRVSIVAAQLPLILAPRARRVLLLGWGGGGAAASALSHPIRELDVVDPSSAAVEAAAWLLPTVGRPLEDSRLRLSVASFEGALRAGGPSYDAIICNGEADEALIRFAKARLAPGGSLAIRVPLSRRPDQGALREALQRALRHFPYASVWSVQDGEGVLLASRRDSPDVRELDAVFKRAAPAAWLRPLGLSYPATLLSLEAADERTSREIAWRRGGREALAALDARATPEGRRRLLLSRYLSQRGRPLQPREYLEILLHPRSPAELPVFRGMLQEWVDRFPRDPRALAFLYVVEEQEGHADRAAALRSRLDSLRRRRHPKPDRGEVIIPGTGR